MPKYYEYKIAGYYLYFTSYCVIECMHVHASDRKLTEAGSAKFFVKDNAALERPQKELDREPALHKQVVESPSLKKGREKLATFVFR